MFKTLLFAGLLAVALAAPSPVAGPSPGPAPSSASLLVPNPLVAPLAPAIVPSLGAPLVYSSYPAPLPLLPGYKPSIIYKDYIY